MIQCRPPLVTAPITEDWRRFNAIHGISESRCVNYKEIYEEMRHGTISVHNLVTIIDYFKYKSEEQLVNQIVNCEAINSTENKENAIEVEGADIYGKYIDGSLQNPVVVLQVPPGVLDSQENNNILPNVDVDVGKEEAQAHEVPVCNIEVATPHGLNTEEMNNLLPNLDMGKEGTSTLAVSHIQVMQVPPPPMV